MKAQCDSLVRALARDRSDYVKAAALHSLARTHDERAYALLQKHLKTASHNDVVASSALAGFHELRDLRALPTLIAYTEPGVPAYLRFSATVALGRMWDFAEKKQQADIRDTFQRLLRDPLHGERRAALAALRSVPDGELMAVVESLSLSDPIGLLRNLARETLRLLHERMGAQSRLGDLRKRIEELSSENKKLRANVGDVEARLAAHGFNGGKKPERRINRRAPSAGR